MYHFEGCLEKFKKQIVNNKELVIWVSIAALLSLVRITLNAKITRWTFFRSQARSEMSS